MKLIAGFILFFTGLQLVVSLVNLLFRQKLTKVSLTNKPLVSVLIPARNEEKNIELLLNDLANQPYKNIEILVFDDESTDYTAHLVHQFEKKDSRVHLLKSTGLPPGWLGKPHACYSLAEKANGSWFLFLDADVRIAKGLIAQTLAFAKKHKLELLSIFPKQILKSGGEKMVVPSMNFILLTLLPLVLIRKTKTTSLSAANGQFMLFESGQYKTVQPHLKLKTEKVEDIRIAQLYKQKRIKIACLSGTDLISCRMYSGLSEAIGGMARSVLMFFGNSALLAVFFWLITTWGFLPVLFAFERPVFIAYFGVLLLIRIIFSHISHQNILNNILMYIPQQIMLGFIIYKAIIKMGTNNFIWKGRNIS